MEIGVARLRADVDESKRLEGVGPRETSGNAADAGEEADDPSRERRHSAGPTGSAPAAVLYANEFGLGKPPDARQLYVGKTEDSLVARDLKTHFGDGRTGQSTVRRWFAALLHDALVLGGIPRNPAQPGYFSNYGLSTADKAAPPGWLRERLQFAVWAKPATALAALRSETIKSNHYLSASFALGPVERSASLDRCHGLSCIALRR